MLFNTLEVIAWPVAISLGSISLMIFILAFRKSINGYIDRAKGVKANIGPDKSIEITAEGKALVQEAVEASKESFKNEVHLAIQPLLYGSYYKNTEAFSQATSWIVNLLKDNIDKEITIDIKMTVVGMAYSWTGFLDNIPSWLKENDHCHINVNVLLTDPSYIDNLSISKTPRNWAEESRKRVVDMRNLVECLTPSLRKRISSTIKIYKSIPQYHGILINDRELFLGRTDWEFDDDLQKSPKLTVGENRYRYFNRYTNQGNDRGSERVDLFLHWHLWYWSFFSEPVLCFKNGNEEKILDH